MSLEPADKTVKLTASQVQSMRDTGLPMSGAFDKLVHEKDTTPNFIIASASGNKSMMGLPTKSIPEVNDPSLAMWEIMSKRVINADHHIREDAAQDDVFSILSDITVACIFGAWKVVATDMEDSAETIKRVYQRIDEMKLVPAFKGGGVNSTDRGALRTSQIHGKYALYLYRNNKAGGKGEISEIVNMSVDGLIRMVNPVDPTDYYFYQEFKKEADYKNPSAWKDVENDADTAVVPSEVQRVWYIPEGEKSRYAKDGDGALLYPIIKEGDWVNVLEDLVYVESPNKTLNDNIVTTIMNKRYLTRMSIIAVQIGIVGLIKIIFGNEQSLPPQAPNELIKDSNPTEYARQKTVFDSFAANMASMIDEVYDAVMNGKPIGYVSTIQVVRDEPKMALTGEFMEQMLLIYDNIIAKAVGIPLTIITSVGTELATSRLTKSVVDVALLDRQSGIHATIMYILKKEFEDEILNEGIDIVLQPLDKADALTSSQVQETIAQAAFTLRRAGATSDTLQNFILANEEIPLQKVDMSGDVNQTGLQETGTASTIVDAPADSTASPEVDDV